MDNLHTLDELRNAHIAHTDAGDFLFVRGRPEKEFYVAGRITKERAGLFFLEIDGEKFTTHKRFGFTVHDNVICIIQPLIKEGVVNLTVRSIEKI